MIDSFGWVVGDCAAGFMRLNDFTPCGKCVFAFTSLLLRQSFTKSIRTLTFHLSSRQIWTFHDLSLFTSIANTEQDRRMDVQDAILLLLLLLRLLSVFLYCRLLLLASFPEVSPCREEALRIAGAWFLQPSSCVIQPAASKHWRDRNSRCNA